MSNKPAVTTTTKAPLPGAQGQLFNNLWGGTGGAVQNALNTQIPQHSVAGPTSAQQAGAENILSVAPNLGVNAQPTSDMLGKIASGFFSNPQNDPNFRGAVSAALDPTYQQLTRSVLPHVQDVSLRASGGGTGPSAYGGTGGGSPGDILTQNVINDWSRNALNTTGTMAEGAYKTGLDLTKLIPSLSASANQQWMAPGMAQLTAGGLQQGWNQGSLQDILNYYKMSTENPLSFLGAGANIGAAGGFGNTTQTGPAPSMATQLLQGGLGGAGMASALFGSGPGGSSSVAGNIGSGLGSAFNWLTPSAGAGAAGGLDAFAASIGVSPEVAASFMAGAAIL